MVDTSRSPKAKLIPVSMEFIEVKEGFWGSRIKQILKISIPAQYELLEETGRIDNFRKASGKIKGNFQGLRFNDTDVYKWIEAASLAMVYSKNSDLRVKINSLVSEISAAQDDNGYLDTRFAFAESSKRWSDLETMHELYCAGHLIQAAVVHHRVTGERKLLDVAIRFADYIDDTFGINKRIGVPGHPEIEMALVELYRETGDKKYLKLATFFLDQRGKGITVRGLSPRIRIDHLPFRDLDEVVGHAVRSLYLNCGAADIYAETSDEAIYMALENLWNNMVSKRMYITGGAGSRYEGESFGDDYELPNRRAYSETCASIANIMWNWRMLLLTGQGRFADVMELALYNGMLSGISLDGKAYFYVNPLSDRGNHRRNKWFTCACCPPNIARTLTSLPGYIYSKSSEGLWVHLYISNKAVISFDTGKVEIVQDTNYPWEGIIHMKISTDIQKPFSIFLRMPSWAEGMDLEVQGGKVKPKVKDGYAEVYRSWEGKTEIMISIQMETNFIESYPHVMNNFGKIAIKRGPIVYCIEQVDNLDFDVWDLAVNTEGKMKSGFRKDILNGVVIVQGEGMVLDYKAYGTNLYVPYKSIRNENKPVNFVAIPYYTWANRKPGPMTTWIKVSK
jgi:DUF1680 family protein